jgi:hypothetical protein
MMMVIVLGAVLLIYLLVFAMATVASDADDEMGLP